MPLSVEKIENGTVIDHITAGCGPRVLEILGIKDGFAGKVALIMNVPSKKLGKKDIVKIEGKPIDEKTADRIALLCPQATLNIVKNSELSEKRTVRLPRAMQGVLKCPNPRCVTNFEKIATIFSTEKDGIRCGFCERVFGAQELA
ncbi:aspartate carbamoyltransferase regulatory subunit [Candidatus Parvarchaeota archaeon]|nr:aspartate carbamoyltransferase regulatory subunit [Candidatus Parvarchaeota archaeon]